MNKSPALTIKSRKITDGSFVFYDPTKLLPSLDEIESTVIITPVQKELISLILSFSNEVNEEHTVLISEMLNSTGLKPITFYKRMEALVKNKLLIPIPFKYYHSDKTGRSKAYVLTLDDRAKVHSELKIERNSQTNHSYRSNAKEIQSAYRSEFFETQSALNHPIISHKNSYIYEQLIDAVPTKSDTKSIVKKFKVASESLTAQIRSHTRIINMDDLKTYYALLTLTYHYHVYVKNHQLDKMQLPVNRTPIHIDDVLDLTYPNRKREANKRVRYNSAAHNKARGSFKALKDTTFEIVGKTDLDILNMKVNGFTSKEFRLVKQLSAFSKQDATIENNQMNFGEKATIFIVEFPDQVFDSLMTDPNLFVFPKELLGLPPMLFGLYLKLRSIINAPTKDEVVTGSIKLALLHQSLAQRQTFEIFRSTFINELRRLKRFTHESISYQHDTQKDEHFINLFGYHMVFQGREDNIFVRLDIDEFLRCCDIQKSTQRAPTKKNQLSATFNPLRSLQSTMVRNTIDRLIVKVNKYHIDISIDPEETPSQVTRYCDVNRTVSSLSEKLGVGADQLTMFFEDKLPKLHQLTVKGRVLTPDDLSLLDDMFENEFSTTSLILSLSRKRRLHDELLSVLDGEQTEFSADFKEQLIESCQQYAA
ncbi:replication initiator protein RctB domain-containing protein [Vibrio anguillarum]|nr:replication initiator protein RctB domain-containing protein [Vibrio anguillarum]